MARAEELGIAAAVTFTGPSARIPRRISPRRTSWSCHRAARACRCRRSRRFALGRAVVATAVGGTPDVVRDGETGWLVPPEEPAALADAIISALSQPDERARRAQLGRALVARHLLDRGDDRPHRGALPLLTTGHAPARRARLPGRPRLPARAHRPGAAAPAGLERRAHPRLPPHRRRPRLARGLAGGTSASRCARCARAARTPIRLDAALELLRGGAVHGRYVCVTFDDGYRDNLLAAAPVLSEYGIPATIYLPSRIIDGDAAVSLVRGSAARALLGRGRRAPRAAG